MLVVYLYGHLAKAYGKRHELDVKSPAEAIRAFCANYKDFKQKLIDGGGYRVLAGKDDRADDIHLPTSKSIKIIPTVQGSGGLGKIVLGAALIAASFYLPGTGYFTSSLLSSFSISATASSIGFSLLLGGVSQLLFSPPKLESGEGERPENKPSYNFNGAVNTTGQGNALQLAYGRLRVGSQLVSAGTETANL
jgi:predicted phage tail protein